jgi:hypothetical protein
MDPLVELVRNVHPSVAVAVGENVEVGCIGERIPQAEYNAPPAA